MPVREFHSPDGRLWRVWAVRPNGFGSDRRRQERRVTPVEALIDPPVIQRRRGADRRVAADGSRGRSRPGDLLPGQWREGWLVFDDGPPDGSHGGHHEMRRLAPIPPRWESCSEAELAVLLARAEVSRRSGGAALGGA
jgi:hypothetical protein